MAKPANRNGDIAGGISPLGPGGAALNYEKSVRALLSLGRELAAPRQARSQQFGLDSITALAAQLGNPQNVSPCVHIAGTNGKGSTAAMLESILRAAGLRTGLYTSPHLIRINERIRIAGGEITNEDFAAAWKRVEAAAESLIAMGTLTIHPAFFECVTAMALVAFADHGVEFAVYEVGLGGRLDATNIVQPEIAILTPVDFDHENFLGHSIEEIAAEKAGIIKPGSWVVSANERPEVRRVIAHRCAQTNARLVELDSAWRLEEKTCSGGRCSALARSSDSRRSLRLAPRLLGSFQVRNALAATAAACLLSERGFAIPDDAIERGIASAEWPGRLEQLCEEPTIYLDGAHNPAGARELAKFWEQNFSGRKIILVYGAMRDKAVDEIAGLLFPLAGTVIFTEPSQPRALSASLLSEMTADLARQSAIVPDASDALERAISMCGPGDAIFATGSLYLVGELRAYWKEPRLRPRTR